MSHHDDELQDLHFRFHTQVSYAQYREEDSIDDELGSSSSRPGNREDEARSVGRVSSSSSSSPEDISTATPGSHQHPKPPQPFGWLHERRSRQPSAAEVSSPPSRRASRAPGLPSASSLLGELDALTASLNQSLSPGDQDDLEQEFAGLRRKRRSLAMPPATPRGKATSRRSSLETPAAAQDFANPESGVDLEAEIVRTQHERDQARNFMKQALAEFQAQDSREGKLASGGRLQRSKQRLQALKDRLSELKRLRAQLPIASTPLQSRITDSVETATPTLQPAPPEPLQAQDEPPVDPGAEVPKPVNPAAAPEAAAEELSSSLPPPASSDSGFQDATGLSHTLAGDPHASLDATADPFLPTAASSPSPGAQSQDDPSPASQDADAVPEELKEESVHPEDPEELEELEDPEELEELEDPDDDEFHQSLLELQEENISLLQADLTNFEDGELLSASVLGELSAIDQSLAESSFWAKARDYRADMDEALAGLDEIGQAISAASAALPQTSPPPVPRADESDEHLACEAAADADDAADFDEELAGDDTRHADSSGADDTSFALGGSSSSDSEDASDGEMLLSFVDEQQQSLSALYQSVFAEDPITAAAGDVDLSDLAGPDLSWEDSFSADQRGRHSLSYSADESNESRVGDSAEGDPQAGSQVDEGLSAADPSAAASESAHDAPLQAMVLPRQEQVEPKAGSARSPDEPTRQVAAAAVAAAGSEPPPSASTGRPEPEASVSTQAQLEVDPAQPPLLTPTTGEGVLSPSLPPPRHPQPEPQPQPQPLSIAKAVVPEAGLPSVDASAATVLGSPPYSPDPGARGEGVETWELVAEVGGDGNDDEEDDVVGKLRDACDELNRSMLEVISMTSQSRHLDQLLAANPIMEPMSLFSDDDDDEEEEDSKPAAAAFGSEDEDFIDDLAEGDNDEDDGDGVEDEAGAGGDDPGSRASQAALSPPAGRARQPSEVRRRRHPLLDLDGQQSPAVIQGVGPAPSLLEDQPELSPIFPRIRRPPPPPTAAARPPVVTVPAEGSAGRKAALLVLAFGLQVLVLWGYHFLAAGQDESDVGSRPRHAFT